MKLRLLAMLLPAILTSTAPARIAAFRGYLSIHLKPSVCCRYVAPALSNISPCRALLRPSKRSTAAETIRYPVLII